MDLNARVDKNCGRKDGQTENQRPILHLVKAGATKIVDGKMDGGKTGCHYGTLLKQVRQENALFSLNVI